MPVRAAAVCSTSGCPELAPCPIHKTHQPNGSQRRQRRGIRGSGWDERARNQRTLRRHHHICHWCGHPGADEVDHVIPLHQGGRDVEANRRPIHHDPCHLDKTRQDTQTPGG